MKGIANAVMDWFRRGEVVFPVGIHQIEGITVRGRVRLVGDHTWRR